MKSEVGLRSEVKSKRINSPDIADTSLISFLYHIPVLMVHILEVDTSRAPTVCDARAVCRACALGRAAAAAAAAASVSLMCCACSMVDSGASELL